MRTFRKPARGMGRMMILALAVFGWQLVCLPVFAELAGDEAVFIDYAGKTCGIISAGSLSVVSTFDCDEHSEGIDITSDGSRAVFGNCRTHTLTLVDLTLEAPIELGQIDSGVSCAAELDIAPDDSFAIVTGSGNGLVSKFTLHPFEVIGTGGPWAPEAPFNGSPQDVHITSEGDMAVQPMFFAEFLPVIDVTQDVPVLLNTIPSPPAPGFPGFFMRHHGVSLSQWDDDTFLATGTPNLNSVTVASLSGLFDPFVLDTPSSPESVDINCDGTRAVIETSTGLMWIDLESTPPLVLSTNFGHSRADNNSTSTVAFSADGTLLFVAGEQQIDIYDVYPDLPEFRGSIPLEGSRIFSIATLPCSAAPSLISAVPSQIEVAVDIKPKNCPNRLNVRSRGVMKVAILGSEDFDATTVDPTTVKIEGVSPLRWKLRDVATPFDSDNVEGDCRDCNREGRDGYLDLVVKFKKQDIVAALGETNDGDCRLLILTGETYEGATIVGDDVVLIQAKKRQYKRWFKNFFTSRLKHVKKEKRGGSCNIEKKKNFSVKQIKWQWHRWDKRR